MSHESGNINEGRNESLKGFQYALDVTRSLEKQRAGEDPIKEAWSNRLLCLLRFTSSRKDTWCDCSESYFIDIE